MKKRQLLSLTAFLIVLYVAAVVLAVEPPTPKPIGAAVPPPTEPPAEVVADKKQHEDGVRVIQHAGEKVTQDSANVPSLVASVDWSANRNGEGVVAISAEFIVGCEEGAAYELKLADKKMGLPELVAFRQKVVGNHGGGDDEDYDCELTLVNGTVAIQDWNPKGGIISGTIRGTLKLTSSNGRIPLFYVEAKKVDLKFWAKLPGE